MEPWRSIWRKGLAPLLSDCGLQALKTALATNDPRLLQGATTSPPPLMLVQDWACEGACLIGLAVAADHGGLVKLAEGLAIKPPHEYATVGEVEEGFGRICFAVDQAVGEPAGCRWLLNWADDTPREEMIDQLLPEVIREIARRESEVVHV